MSETYFNERLSTLHFWSVTKDFCKQVFLLGRPNRFLALDGLRAYAILLVFCVHLMGMHYQSGYYVEPQSPIWRICWTLHAGYIGVDLFFVLSGFLTYLSVAARPDIKVGARKFLEKRFRRLVPALFWTLLVFEAFGRLGVQVGVEIGLLSLVVYTLLRNIRPFQTCLFSFYQAFPDLVVISFLGVTFLMITFRQVILASSDLKFYLSYLVNFMLLWQFFLDFRKMNSVIWTLSVQMLFYYAAAFLVWFKQKKITLGWKVLIPAILVAYSTQWFVPDPISQFGLRLDPLNTIQRSAAFLAGIAIAKVYTKPRIWERLRPIVSILSTTCLPLIALMQFARHNVISTLHWPGNLDFALYYIVLDVLLMAVVAGALIPTSIVHKLFSFKPLRLLGIVSYSFFLIHTLVINYSFPLFAPYSFRRMWVHFTVSLLISIPLSVSMFYFLERPYFVNGNYRMSQSRVKRSLL